MLDALTMSELNDAIAAGVSSHTKTKQQLRGDALPTIIPVSLPLETGAALDAHIDKVRDQYADIVLDARHAYFLFTDYGSKSLRARKLAPKSAFQMVVQLAAQAHYGDEVFTNRYSLALLVCIYSYRLS
jgi:hypothetical protein